MEPVAISAVKTSCYEMWMHSQEILWTRPLSGDHFEIEDIQACLDAYQEFTRERKIVQILDFRINVPQFPRKGRDLAVEGTKNHFKAIAVLGDSLAVKMVVNFCNRVYDDHVPLKSFRTEEDAIKWLKQFTA